MAAVERAEEKYTHLTAWFKLNTDNPEARNLFYLQIPKRYTFDRSKKEWKLRRQNVEN